MKRNFFLAMLLALPSILLSGCFIIPRNVYIEDGSDERFIEAADHCVEFWNGKLKMDYLKLKIVNRLTKGYFHPINMIITFDKQIAAPNGKDYDGLCTSVVTNNTLIRTNHAFIKIEMNVLNKGQEYTNNVMCHEFGHAMGLSHKNTEGNLMQPSRYGHEYDLTKKQIRWAKALMIMM